MTDHQPATQPDSGTSAPAAATPPTTGTSSEPRARSRSKPFKGPSFAMAVPALAFFGLFALLPLAGVAALSLTSWDGLGPISWAGLDEWRRALTNPVTHRAMWLTVLFVVGSYLFQAPVALLLGVFMAGRQKYRAVLSLLYFLPLLFSSAAIGITFQSLLDPNFGLSRAFGAGFLNRQWLGDPNIALFIVVFVVGWSFIPFHSLLYQAGVRNIPPTMYEAADIDGAGAVQKFFYITLPQLRYTIVTSSTLMLVGSLTYFDLVFVLTMGGPGNATRILPLDMYLKGFRSYQMGQASAIALILVIGGLGIALLLSRISGASKMESQQAGL